MAQDLFPWLFSSSIILCVVFCMVSASGLRNARPLNATFATLAWAGFLAMLGFGMYLISEGVVGSHWSFALLPIPGSSKEAEAGLLLQTPGILVCWLVALIYGYVFFIEPAFMDGKSPEQSGSSFGATQGAAALSLAAVALASMSLSIWSALLAQVLAALAGWFILSGLSSAERSFSRVAVTFVRERGIAMLLIILGVATAVSAGPTFDWREPTPAAGTLPTLSLVLLFLGLILQLQIFPVMGWGIQTSGVRALPTTVQFLVANSAHWASFLVLARLAPLFIQEDLGQVLIFVTLGLTAATAWVSLSVQSAQSAFLSMASAMTAMNGVALLIAGNRVGMSFFVCSQIVLWGAALFLRRDLARMTSSSTQWVRGLLVTALCAGPGFVSGASLMSMLEGAPSVVLGVAIAVTWLLLTLAAMRTFALPLATVPEDLSVLLRVKDATSILAKNIPAALAGTIVLAGLWCGDFFAGFYEAPEGAPALNWSAQLFEGKIPAHDSSIQLLAWSWSGALLMMLLTGLPTRLVRFQWFFARSASQCFEVARLVSTLLEAGVRFIETTVAQWNARIREPLSALPGLWLRQLSFAVGQAVRKLVTLLDRVARESVEIPAKALQLIQSGSVQLYLLFTVGFTIAMLLHFWSHMKS